MNTVALAILAHPDDAEFLCAGTLDPAARPSTGGRSTSPA